MSKSLKFKKPPVASPRVTVEQIHHEFDTAADKALAEAREILSHDVEKNEVAERLLTLGFTQTAEVKKHTNAIETRKKFLNRESMILQWQQKYPTLKFIMEDQVEAICKKYRLLCAPVSRYRGTVPEKNLIEIEKNAALIKKEDAESAFNWMSRMYIRYATSLGEPIPSAVDDTRHIFICAPAKDIDTTNMQVRDGYKLQHIPDPVVMQKVMDGYLILSAWGEEASDENVVNQKMN